MATRNYYTSVVMGSTGPGLPLANVPYYAYALAKIHSSATIAGTCVRSDGATQAIGFVGIDLDTAAIATFCGALQGGFYLAEQSGLGLDVTVGTFAAAPLIYDGSSVITEPINGKPAMYFTTSSRQIIATTSLFNFLHNGTNSAIIVQATAGITSNPNTNYAYVGNNGNTSTKIGALLMYDDRSALSFNDRGVSLIVKGINNFYVGRLGIDNIITGGEPHLISNFINLTNPTLNERAVVAVDGGAILPGNTYNETPSVSNATHTMQLGGSGNATVAPFAGYYQAAIFYDTDQQSNKSAIETPLLAYW